MYCAAVGHEMTVLPTPHRRRAIFPPLPPPPPPSPANRHGHNSKQLDRRQARQPIARRCVAARRFAYLTGATYRLQSSGSRLLLTTVSSLPRFGGRREALVQPAPLPPPHPLRPPGPGQQATARHPRRYFSNPSSRTDEKLRRTWPGHAPRRTKRNRRNNRQATVARCDARHSRRCYCSNR